MAGKRKAAQDYFGKPITKGTHVIVAKGRHEGLSGVVSRTDGEVCEFPVGMHGQSVTVACSNVIVASKARNPEAVKKPVSALQQVINAIRQKFPDLKSFPQEDEYVRVPSGFMSQRVVTLEDMRPVNQGGLGLRFFVTRLSKASTMELASTPNLYVSPAEDMPASMKPALDALPSTSGPKSESWNTPVFSQDTKILSSPDPMESLKVQDPKKVIAKFNAFVKTLAHPKRLTSEEIDTNLILAEMRRFSVLEKVEFQVSQESGVIQVGYWGEMGDKPAGYRGYQRAQTQKDYDEDMDHRVKGTQELLKDVKSYVKQKDLTRFFESITPMPVTDQNDWRGVDLVPVSKLIPRFKAAGEQMWKAQWAALKGK